MFDVSEAKVKTHCGDERYRFVFTDAKSSGDMHLRGDPQHTYIMKAKEWCENNKGEIIHGYYNRIIAFYFYDKKKALEFKMRWV